MKYCSNCGTKYTDEAVFCQKCGSKLIQKETCPSCGCEIMPGQIFCSQCGRRIKENEQADKQTNPAVASAGAPMSPAAPSADSRMEKAKERTFGKKVLLLAAIPVVIAVFCGLLWLAFGSNGGTGADFQQSQVQANLSNGGFAAKLGDTVYVSDFQTGIFVYEDGQLGQQIAEGYYTDLAAVGKNLFCIEILDGNSEQCVVKKIDPDINTSVTVFEDPEGACWLYALAVIDGRYYFVAQNDRLCYIEEDGMVTSTEHRYVKQVTKEGVFTAASGNLGLTFNSFDGKLSIQYDELTNCIVDVYFEKEGTAAIRYYRPDEMGGQIALLDITEGTLTDIFYEPAWGMEQDVPTNVVTSKTNFYGDKLVIGISSVALTEETFEFDGFTNSYYYLNQTSHELTPIHSDTNYWTANIIVIDDNFYTFNPNQGKDGLTVVPAATSGKSPAGQQDGIAQAGRDDKGSLWNTLSNIGKKTPEPPSLEEVLPWITSNSDLANIGVLPFGNQYEYSLDEEKSSLTQDHCTRAVRLQYTEGLFSIDTTIYADFSYDAEAEEWTFEGVTAPEAQTYTYDLEGMWMVENDYNFLSSYSLAPGESDLKILIYDFVPNWDPSTETFGTFSWNSANCEFMGPYGVGEFKYVDAGDGKCMQLWFLPPEGRGSYWLIRVNPGEISYPESGMNGTGVNLVKIVE